MSFGRGTFRLVCQPLLLANSFFSAPCEQTALLFVASLFTLLSDPASSLGKSHSSTSVPCCSSRACSPSCLVVSCRCRETAI
ncbi:hypothetical protein EDC04DRAFT_2796040 [Pisolithus marmoratus]|nr:hypothetical protein EDC04DRAFT_2796040 [Pisolithus marmoratus]